MARGPGDSDDGDDDDERGVRRGLRLHGALDVGFAALYAWLGFGMAPGRDRAWNVALATVVALVAAAGVALLVRPRRGRVVALAAQAVLLVFAATVVALIVASAAYLRGVFGPIGQGLAAVSLLVAAVVVELCALLPLAQLRFLLRADVRSYCAGVAPSSTGSRAASVEPETLG